MTHSKKRFILVTAAYCLGLLFILTTAYAVTHSVVRVSVDHVELSDPKHPELKVTRIGVLKKDTPEQRLTLKVDFTVGAGGCIDWTDAENRSKAMVLGLKQGDILEAEVSEEKGIFLVKHIKYAEAGQAMHFPGMEKVKSASVFGTFDTPETRVGVIVSLACPVGGDSGHGCSKPCKKAVTKTKWLQDSVLASLSEKEFKLESRMENIPVFSGRITLKGLKTLASHPLVSSIEEDRPQQLFPQSTGGIRQ